MTAGDSRGRTNKADSPPLGPPRTRRKRTPRGRSKHPGVVLVKPEAEHIKWRAEWDDPDTGKRRRATLERVDPKTFETREAWAVAKSEQLQRAHSDRKLGIARPIDVELPKAIAAYIASG